MYYLEKLVKTLTGKNHLAAADFTSSLKVLKIRICFSTSVLLISLVKECQNETNSALEVPRKEIKPVFF